MNLGQFSRLRSPFEWELVSRNLVAMAAMGLGFFIITLLCEFRFFIKPRRLPLNPYMAPPDEDQDVANERKRALRGSGCRDLLRLENLTKVTLVLVFKVTICLSVSTPPTNCVKIQILSLFRFTKPVNRVVTWP